METAQNLRRLRLWPPPFRRPADDFIVTAMMIGFAAAVAGLFCWSKLVVPMARMLQPADEPATTA